MIRQSKKIFSLVMAACLILGMIPLTAAATTLAPADWNGVQTAIDSAADGDVLNLSGLSSPDIVYTFTIRTGLELTIKGNSATTFKYIAFVCAGNNAITIENLNIQSQSGQFNGFSPLHFNGTGNILTLVGENTIVSGIAGGETSYGAAVGVPSGSELTISDGGKLTAIGGPFGAGIGGGHSKSGGDITIIGGTIIASGGAGIGGGNNGAGGNITISGNADVTASGGSGAGIGGGGSKSGGNITISGNAKVTASGGDFSQNGSAGIGGGNNGGAGGNITINGGANVTATGGNGKDNGSTGGAGIGGGGNSGTGNGGTGGIIIINGGTVTATGGDGSYGGAGIGGGAGMISGAGGAGGNITISGGNVTANGGTGIYYSSNNGGAGIGGGFYGTGGTTTISGGNVTAIGGSRGAGIGGGGSSTGNAGGDILIYGESTAVTARGAQDIGNSANYIGTGGNTFVALPQGQLKNASGYFGNTVAFMATPASAGTVTATLPAPFDTAGAIDILSDPGLTAKNLSVITTFTTQSVYFALATFTGIPKTGNDLRAIGATVPFGGVPTAQAIAAATYSAAPYSVGNPITSTAGTYTANDGGAAGTHTYKWYRADDNAGLNETVIVGATALAYTPVAADFGKWVYIETTPVGSVGLTGTPVRSGYIQIGVRLSVQAIGAGSGTATVGGSASTVVYNTTAVNIVVTKNTATDTVAWSALPNVGAFGSTTADSTTYTPPAAPTGDITLTAALTAATTYSYNTPAAITANGVTATVSYSPASPQAASTLVTATVTLTGNAAAAGTHTVGLTSATLVGGVTSPGTVTKTVTVGQGMVAGDTFAFTFIMQASAVNDLVLTHTYSAAPTYTITSTAGAGGSITPSGAQPVTSGGSLTFTIAPSGNYYISDVLVDSVSVGAVGSYTFNNVTANHTISASFGNSGGTYNGGGDSSSFSSLRIVNNIITITQLSGNSTRLGVQATGGNPPYTYQWQRKGSWIDIPGATSAEFTWTGLEPGKTYTVRCIVKDRLGKTVTSPEKAFIAGEGLSAFPFNGEVTSKNVSVRPNANTKGKALGRLQTGDEVSILGYTAPKGYPYGFFKIAWDNTAGYAYISADYVSVTFGTPFNASILGRVYLQSRMNTAKKYRLATLTKDDTAKLLGRYKTWWLVEWQGDRVYLKNGKFIQP